MFENHRCVGLTFNCPQCEKNFEVAVTALDEAWGCTMDCTNCGKTLHLSKERGLVNFEKVLQENYEEFEFQEGRVPGSAPLFDFLESDN